MASKVAFAKPDIEKPDMVIEQSYPIAGGSVTVIFTRITPGRLPSAYISAEPADASVALTRIRDQVHLLNDLRKWGKERLLKTLIDADSDLHPVFLVAQTVMEAR